MIPQRIIMPPEDSVRREMRAKRVMVYLSGLDPKKAWRVTIEEAIRKRSLSQKAYLWSIYEHLLKVGGPDLAGWEKEDLHDFFLGEWSGWEPKVLYGRKRLRPLKRSSKLNKQDFTDFLDFIMRFMAQRGIYIPSPDENWQEVA